MVEIADIKDRDSFREWLKDKPVEWGRVLAPRTALRVAPFGFLDGEKPFTSGSEITPQHLTVTVFRATLISRVAGSYPTRDMSRATRATRAAADAADAADAALAALAASRAATDASRAALAAAALAAAYAADADISAGYAALAASRAASRAAEQIWSAIRTDCELLERQMNLYTVLEVGSEDLAAEKQKAAANLSAQHLLSDPLWQDEKGEALYKKGMPDWAFKPFDAFAQSDLAKETSFSLIVDWYGDFCRGGTQSIFKGKADLEIAEQPDEFWKGDTVEVMDRVAKIAGWERGETSREGEPEAKDNSETEVDASQPLPPPQGSGPSFGAKNGVLSRTLTLPSLDEAENPGVQKLLERLKKRMELFLKISGNQLGRFPALSAVLDDYKSAIDADDAASIDVHELWMSGAGLISQARSFAALDPEKQVTEPLEPEAQGLLGEMARLHGALVMSFSQGRILAEQSGIPLLSSEDFATLLQHEKDIVRWLLVSEQYDLSDSAREVFEQIDRYIYNATDSADQIARIAYPTIRNLLILTANTLEHVERIGGRLSMAGVPVHLFIAGAMYFLRDNFGSITAFASSVPELRGYLEYHLKRLEIDYQSDIQIGNDDEDGNK